MDLGGKILEDQWKECHSGPEKWKERAYVRSQMSNWKLLVTDCKSGERRGDVSDVLKHFSLFYLKELFPFKWGNRQNVFVTPQLCKENMAIYFL